MRILLVCLRRGWGLRWWLCWRCWLLRGASRVGRAASAGGVHAHEQARCCEASSGGCCWAYEDVRSGEREHRRWPGVRLRAAGAAGGRAAHARVQSVVLSEGVCRPVRGSLPASVQERVGSTEGRQHLGNCFEKRRRNGGSVAAFMPVSRCGPPAGSKKIDCVLHHISGAAAYAIAVARVPRRKHRPARLGFPGGIFGLRSPRSEPVSAVGAFRVKASAS